MNETTTSPALRLRLSGVVFLLVLGLLLGLSVAVYQQAFTPVVGIRLQADSIGNQLEPDADVKLRGLIVGEVRGVHADGTRATVDIALKPEDVQDIPADVDAQLLPKTLFGEKYVNLVLPAGGGSGGTTGRHIRAGDVITQDHTTIGTEVQHVLNDLLPLLRTLQPGELNAALSAISDALEGRGDAIGGNLVRADTYFAALNPHLPALKQDITALAQVADVYADAAPDLLRILQNTVTTSRTLVDKRDVLDAFLTSTTTFAHTATGVLDEDQQRLITLAGVSRPTLSLLATYAPEYPCLLSGLVKFEPIDEQTFSGGHLHITLEVVLPRSAYHPGEYPAYEDTSGPNCRGLPDPQVPAPGVDLKDGTTADNTSPLASGPNTGLAGTAAEQHVVNSLLAPVMDVPADQVPPVATLLMGPLMRGTAVSAS
ncbi:mammalian cell entry protein [Streptacidiphilus pinicola]|uniref:Mammalian cell entry protein n=1 Tax=Streptacidiphilus pinicola TaxID=2219663 RepID=A0A2X0KIX4_9ACTN|nr:MCE family protein [Streptacidiphilus pinicola]RAG86690.1 mammalian cell entry protein [Streptacidiphilus pinicola]